MIYGDWSNIVLLVVITFIILIFILNIIFKYRFAQYKNYTYYEFLKTYRKFIYKHSDVYNVEEMPQHIMKDDCIDYQDEFNNLYKRPFEISALLSIIYNNGVICSKYIYHVPKKHKIHKNTFLLTVNQFPDRLSSYLPMAKKIIKLSPTRISTPYSNSSNMTYICFLTNVIDKQLVTKTDLIKVRFNIILDFLTWLFKK